MSKTKPTITPTRTDTPTPRHTATFTPTPKPTATFTPTPTPRPAPPQPTGWIRATPAKIALGQSTLIAAGWSNVDDSPSIIVGDSLVLAESCSGGSGDSSDSGRERSTRAPTPPTLPEAQATKTLHGCNDGLTTVQLLAGNKTLATVTVTVVPLPKITGHEQVAYRWLNITWSGHSDYTSYTVEWRRKTDTEWIALSATPAGTGEADRSRAIVSGHSADIRGLPFKRQTIHGDPDREIVVRVIGRVGDRTATGRRMP